MSRSRTTPDKPCATSEAREAEPAGDAREEAGGRQEAEALRAAQAGLAGIIDSAMDAIITVDEEQRIVLFNRAAERMFLYPAKDALGQPLDRFIPERFRQAHRTHVRQFGTTHVTRRAMGALGALFALRADGEEFPIEASISQVEAEGRKLYTVILRDITERRRAEEQLRRSQKMEAVGQLAGGIAHDFNNLLTVINGYSDLVLRRLQAEDPLRKSVEEIRKAGERAAALTRQLLAFSGKQVLQPVVLDLNSVVSDMEKMLRRLIGEDVELRTALAHDLGSIKADPGQVEQVIMNLCVNAREAMPHGGRLAIETANVYLGEDYAARRLTDFTPGPYVVLKVTDTGTGMDEETREHIFEPFFTTKGAGKGTGLGLSTVYGIVRQSGGSVRVSSEVGRGSTFEVYFPRAGEDAQEYRRGAEPEEDLRGAETILLAEDEEMVRRLAREVLEIYGYRVLVATGGSAALLICERHEGPISLLVTDVVMPEMSGRELAARLAHMRPEMKVLYMSGYTDASVAGQESLEDRSDFLQKPFTPAALARKVREMLDRT
jgi:two-component system, cell cycle sensor histidine kinase and response regulator CckA